MTLPALLFAVFAFAAPDTTVLASAQASLWSQRPEVLLVRDSGATQLVVTARDPLFFSRNVATLYPAGDTAGHAVAVVASDSSSVDARSSTNRHTLRFPVTEAQLKAWGAGKSPRLEVGGLLVKLPGGGRKALQRLVRGAGTVAPR